LFKKYLNLSRRHDPQYDLSGMDLRGVPAIYWGGMIRKNKTQRCPVSLSSHIGAQA